MQWSLALHANKLLLSLWIALTMTAPASLEPARAQSVQTIAVRGHAQSVHIYGARGGKPVIVSSGDGGWVHLAPHIAELLAANGFFVVGFDAKAYLESFTSGAATLREEDVPGDYHTLAAYAAQGSNGKPILVGVSEGAGLSVLAATDSATKSALAGVVAVGLPDLTELGWRWRDSVIYITHGMPKEPMFSVAGIVERVAPLPLAAIHSSHDEYIPVATAQKVMETAHEPKKLWVIQSSDHRFAGNTGEFDKRLLEALQWVNQSQPR